MASSNWFKDWFNSPYYHVLYKNRDIKEAELFINNLLSHLSPPQNAHFLDVACGKGRHSIYLNKQGYVVTGIDLSENNIKQANKYSNPTLHFIVQDMREPFRGETFDYVINLFTSFGYFNKEGDNQRVLDAAYADLRPGGTLIIDFFNAKCVVDNLVKHEVKECDGVRFNIQKHLDGKVLTKQIEFTADGETKHYTEKVKTYNLADLTEMLIQAGFTIKNIWGNYQLTPFNESTSDRLIIEAVK